LRPLNPHDERRVIVLHLRTRRGETDAHEADAGIPSV